jgi:uncharacterized protein (UPF0333 family)
MLMMKDKRGNLSSEESFGDLVILVASFDDV